MGVFARSAREGARNRNGLWYELGPISPSGERAKKQSVLLQVCVLLTTFKERSMSRSDYREVYSSDSGTICPKCSKPVAKCECRARSEQQILGDGQVRVRRESKGRGGKQVTTVTGIPYPQSELEALLKVLKNSCGCGGTIKNGTLELQGDRRDAVMTELTRRNLKPKLAGG
jgi:translation initiation factor 1